MKPLPLTFALQPSGPGHWLLGTRRSLVSWAGLVALVLALAWTAQTAWQTWGARQQVAAARQAVDAAVRLAGNRRTSERAIAANAPPSQQAAWAELARQLNMPWGALLTSLEQATPDDVALVSIAPDPRLGQIGVLAEAESLPPLLAYARQLQSAPQLLDVTLTRHEASDNVPHRPMRLHLELRWRSLPGSTR